MFDCMVPISIGELLDKITILEIKSERIADKAKLLNVRKELELLRDTWTRLGIERPELAQLMTQLKDVNERLWEIEDNIRGQESLRSFGPEFVELARTVYVTNDERASLKREINDLTGSSLVEEKSYRNYAAEVDSTE